ncbi:MAG: hypothetical protein RIT45_1108 [Pseudomonadota bacterium]|jgi:hypothetical protein
MNRKQITALVASLSLAATLLVPAFASAQQKRNSVRGKGDIKVSDYDGRGGGGGSVDLGVAEIEGRIFKPSVFFVLARRDFQYQGIQFKQSFSDRIIKDAMLRPF